MPNLFGIDIGQLVLDAINEAGGLQTVVLVKRGTFMEDKDDPTRPPVMGEDTRHECQGFIDQRSVRLLGTLVNETVAVLSILAKSLPEGCEPKPGDKATLGNMTYELGRLLELDPAKAMYEFEVS